MHVVHVIPGLATRTGGPAVAVVELARSLEEAGVRTTIVATDQVGPAGTRSGVTPAQMPPGAELLDVRLAPVRAPRRLAYAPRLGGMVEDALGTADAVHLHSLFLYPQFAGARAARRHDRPYVVSLRGALDPALSGRGRARKAATELLWQRRMLRNADALHLTSPAERDQIAGVAPGVPRHVVPNIVRAPDPMPDPADLAALGLRPGAPLIVFLGRIAPKKRVDLLLDALASPPLRSAGAQLAVAGPDDDDLGPGLRDQARRLGIDDRVRFLGMVEGEERWRLLRAGTAFALPSRGENFGIAVVEAMTAGTPAVITPEVYLAEDVGRAAVVTPGTAGDFARELARIVGDAGAREGLSAAGAAFAGRFRPEAVAPQMIAVYEAVARGHRSRLPSVQSPRLEGEG